MVDAVTKCYVLLRIQHDIKTVWFRNIALVTARGSRERKHIAPSRDLFGFQLHVLRLSGKNDPNGLHSTSLISAAAREHGVGTLANCFE